MNPVLIPVMAQQGLPGMRQVSQLPAVPTGAGDTAAPARPLP